MSHSPHTSTIHRSLKMSLQLYNNITLTSLTCINKTFFFFNTGILCFKGANPVNLLILWFQIWPWHLPLSLPLCIPAPSRPWTDPSCTQWKIPWRWGWSGKQCTHTGGRPAWRWSWPSPGTPQLLAQSGRSRGGRQWSGPGDTLVLSQSEKNYLSMSFFYTNTTPFYFPVIFNK